jgi:hypothetical protein
MKENQTGSQGLRVAEGIRGSEVLTEVPEGFGKYAFAEARRGC